MVGILLNAQGVSRMVYELLKVRHQMASESLDRSVRLKTSE
jgi:hypothetical protein